MGDSGALPALEVLRLDDVPASPAAKDAASEALAKSRGSTTLPLDNFFVRQATS